MAIAATLVAGLCAAAGPGPERVLLLYNANWTADEDADGVQDSLQVAQYYAAKRGVPAQNLLGLACTTAYRYETAQYALFHQQVVAPITNRLAALGPESIDVLLFGYATPYCLVAPNGWGTISLDTAVAVPHALDATDAGSLPVWESNPYFEPTPTFGTDLGHFDHALYRHTSGQPYYLVGRLDGPGGVGRILSLVDQALYAERHVWPADGHYRGFIYIDSQNRKGMNPYDDAALRADSDVQGGHYGSYAATDVNIASGVHFAAPATPGGFALKWEQTGEDIGYPGLVYHDGTSATNAPRALMYGGWYNYNNYRDVWEWLPGSAACDLNSTSMLHTDFRKPVYGWGAGALAQGASCVSGAVDEPYTSGHPRPNVLLAYLLGGYCWAEASSLANPAIGFRTLHVGDPLYNPMPAGKVPVLDTLAPALAPGYPRVVYGDARGTELLVCLDDGAGPEVAAAALDWGLSPAYGAAPFRPKGFFRHHRFRFPELLSATAYHCRLRLTDPVGLVAETNDWTFMSPAQIPYGGITSAIPGTVQVELFDQGGEGVAYHGAGEPYAVSTFRPTAGFDLRTSNYNPGKPGFLNVPQPGFWLEYTVNVAVGGRYRVDIGCGAFSRSGGQVRLDVDGVDASGIVDLRSDGPGNWDSWVETPVYDLHLTAGLHVLRLNILTQTGPLSYLRFSEDGLPPVPAFSFTPTNGVAPLTVAFDGAASHDPDGTIVSHAWSFGDGGSATGVATSHTYAAVGNWTATLTVTDNDGHSASTSAVVRVASPFDPDALPFRESFEPGEPWMANVPGPLDGQNGWRAEPAAGAVVQGADVGAGLQAGRLTDGHVQHDANGGATNVWLELRMKPSATAATNPAALLPAELAGAAAVFWTTPSNTLAAYDGPTPTIVETATFATDRWTRVSVNCDYVARRWSLWLDDVPAIAGFAFYSAAPAAGCTGFGLIEREGGGDTWIDDLRLAATPPGDDDGDGLPDTWELAFFGDLSQEPDGDWDGDRFLNGDEYLAGTDATNAASYLGFERVERTAAGAVLRWQSVAGRSYRLQLADALPPAWTNRATGLPATPPLNVHTDRTATTPAFYRLLLE